MAQRALKLKLRNLHQPPLQRSEGSGGDGEPSKETGRSAPLQPVFVCGRGRLCLSEGAVTQTVWGQTTKQKGKNVRTRCCVSALCKPADHAHAGRLSRGHTSLRGVSHRMQALQGVGQTESSMVRNAAKRRRRLSRLEDCKVLTKQPHFSFDLTGRSYTL